VDVSSTVATDTARTAWGRLARLQVQRGPLKLGPKGARRYDPAGIVQVDELTVDRDGVVGRAAAGEVLDVHHVAHPQSRNSRGRNAVSIGTTADYAQMRAQFGAHVSDGIAGENLLVETDQPIGTLAGLTALCVESVDGSELMLTELGIAAPCVEFTRLCLGRDDTETDDEVLAAMPALEGGRRGWYAVAVGGPVRLRAGARVWAVLSR
jgi:hypothetical protein